MATARQTRETEKREAAPVHDLQDRPWVQGASLTMPLARPGHDQRWIRFQYATGESDATNLSRKMRQGWKPREAESVSEEWQMMVGTAGRITGIIVEGSILCERPMGISRRRNEAFQIETQRRTDALSHDLDSVNAANKSKIYGPIRKATSSVPYREVKVQDDDQGQSPEDL